MSVNEANNIVLFVINVCHLFGIQVDPRPNVHLQTEVLFRKSGLRNDVVQGLANP